MRTNINQQFPRNRTLAWTGLSMHPIRNSNIRPITSPRILMEESSSLCRKGKRTADGIIAVRVRTRTSSRTYVWVLMRRNTSVATRTSRSYDIDNPSNDQSVDPRRRLNRSDKSSETKRLEEGLGCTSFQSKLVHQSRSMLRSTRTTNRAQGKTQEATIRMTQGRRSIAASWPMLLMLLSLLCTQVNCFAFQGAAVAKPWRASQRVPYPHANANADSSSLRTGHLQIHPQTQAQPCRRQHQSRRASPLQPMPMLPNGQASLIGPNDMWGNVAALTSIASFSQILGKRTRLGRLLGPPVTAIALSFLLASTGILNPGGTTTAKALQSLMLQLATPLVLLGADLRNCLERCGPLLLSFVVAAFATVVSAFVGWKISGNMLIAALGPDALIIAAALMAKNVGGGINYITVCRSLSASPQAVAAGLCIDNIFALIYFPITSALAAGRPDVAPPKALHGDDDDAEASTEEVAEAPTGALAVEAISLSVFISTVLLWLGEKIAGKSGGLPCSTLLTVFFASVAPAKWISGLKSSADTLGTACLYVFFATAGAPGLAVAPAVRASLVPLTIFLTTIYSIHGFILWLCNRIGGKRFAAFTPQRLLVASSAAIGGPATSAALAQANQWDNLIVPSLLVGNIGYTVATFCALAYHAILK